MALTRASVLAVSFFALLTGCGHADPEHADVATDAGPQPVVGCSPGELARDDGSCQRAGIPTCGEGFASDGRGSCTAVLPAQPCPRGQLAALGQNDCHEVAPCAPGTWGDIALEATTQFVDKSFAGGASDGTKAKPWTTINQAIAAAAPGAIVAIAAGSYAEDVVASKTVRLWGRCPSMVEITGSPRGLGAIDVRADRTEIHDLAVKGGSGGIGISGALDVVVERVWIHDTADNGLDVEDVLGPTRATFRNVLVEAAGRQTAFVSGGEITLEGSTFRDSAAKGAADAGVGRGLDVETAFGPSPAKTTVRSCIFERNRDTGVFVDGADVTLDRVLVRDTLAATDGYGGRGLQAQVHPKKNRPANVTVLSSVIEKNREVSVYVSGSDLRMEGTVVRGTLPADADQHGGKGFTVRPDATIHRRSNFTLRASVVEDNREVGVLVGGSDILFEGVVVRDTRARVSDGAGGGGLAFLLYPDPPARANGTVRGSSFERNETFGVVVTDSDLVLDSTQVIDTKPRESDGAYGDGIEVGMATGPASATVTSSRFQGNARAAIASFAGTVRIGNTTLSCNSIDLDGERIGASAFEFVDLGGTACGCGDRTTTCTVLSSQLVPPPPLDPK